MRRGMSVGPVIGELKLDAEIRTLQQRDDLLQGVAVLAADAHHVALYGGCLLYTSISLDIFFRDPPARAGTGDLREIEIVLPRHLADER